MKNLLLSFMMLTGLTSVAQDIKFKKDKISIDGTEVAILDKVKVNYKILSLDSRPIFSIERKSALMADGSTFYWSVLTDLSNNKTNEVVDYGKDQGLSFQKTIVASVCNDKYKFISSAGIDEKGVLEFINGTPTDIEKVIADANQKTVDQLKTEMDAMAALKIKVTDGVIYQKQDVLKENGVVQDYVKIGSVVKQNITFMANWPPSLVYMVNSVFTTVDNNNREQVRVREIGGWYATKTGYANPKTGKNIKDEIITADNKYFPLKGTLTDTEKINLSFSKGDKDLLEKQIVAKLLYNGYKFEAMK
ncbi:hypothetical protein HNP37_000953 [Flavobacterium nitrogenifigens]|uniref:Uncharacterized protein n=2 Tax=Flavobacterium TaxID=237 RepID=A0A7W7N6Y7_9FLAO|nr:MULTISPECIES: hypothetical protein [Flavobacterium]MBB4800914.1 hypothetical protein [Flavobacterium nitrogenifigens]MBB6385338.1 hypothetical protein [Flavobacterium notoginsengisoli]